MIAMSLFPREDSRLRNLLAFDFKSPTEMDREKILYQQPIGGGKYQFAARMSVTDDSVIEELTTLVRVKCSGDMLQEQSCIRMNRENALQLLVTDFCFLHNQLAGTLCSIT